MDKIDDSDKLLKCLKGLSADWKKKLADPVFLKLVKNGKVQVSPLIKELVKILCK